MSRLMTALAVLCLTATPVLADQVHPELVDANARWMAHVNLEGVFASRMFAEARRLHGEDLDEKVQEIHSEVGIDVLKDLRSVTLYGIDESEENGVLILHGSDALDGLLDRIGQIDGYRKDEVDGYTLHVVGENGGGMVGSLLQIKGGGRLVAVAKDQGRLVKALDVLHGRAPSLLTQEGRIQARSSDGALVTVVADLDGSRLTRMEPVSRVARMARYVHFEMGERQDQMFLDANLKTRSESEARSIAQIVQGAMALVNLAAQGESDPELEIIKDLMAGVQSSAEGNNVHLSFTCALDTLLEMAKARGGF